MAGDIVIELTMRNEPGSPLLRWVGQGKEGNHRSFDGSRDVHWSGVVGNGQISGLDERTQGWKGEYTGYCKGRMTILWLHTGKHLGNQRTLILCSCHHNECSQLFNQQINHLGIHLPW